MYSSKSKGFTDLVVAILLHEYEKSLPLPTKSDEPHDSHVEIHSDSTDRCTESVPNRLPGGCVLASVRNLQLLVKVSHFVLLFCDYFKMFLFTQSSLEYMNGFKDKHNAELPAASITQNTVSVTDLDIPEQYSVGATALDCSVMLTFQRLDDNQQRYIDNSTYNLYGYALG